MGPYLQQQDTKINKVKKVLVPLIVLAFLGLSFSLIYDEVQRNQDLRARAGGGVTKAICGDKACDDGRCVGETWRECDPCPDGKARAVFRVSCNEDIYSDCTFDDSVCND